MSKRPLAVAELFVCIVDVPATGAVTHVQQDIGTLQPKNTTRIDTCI